MKETLLLSLLLLIRISNSLGFSDFLQLQREKRVFSVHFSSSSLFFLSHSRSFNFHSLFPVSFAKDFSRFVSSSRFCVFCSTTGRSFPRTKRPVPFSFFFLLKNVIVVCPDSQLLTIERLSFSKVYSPVWSELSLYSFSILILSQVQGSHSSKLRHRLVTMFKH